MEQHAYHLINTIRNNGHNLEVNLTELRYCRKTLLELRGLHPNYAIVGICVEELSFLSKEFQKKHFFTMSSETKNFCEHPDSKVHSQKILHQNRTKMKNMRNRLLVQEYITLEQ